MLWPRCEVGEEVDVSQHILVHHQRQVALGGRQLRLNLGSKVGVHFKGHILGHVGGRLFHFGDKAIALFERFHLHRVDGIHNAVELFLQARLALDFDDAREHQIDGAVEVHLGFRELAFAVVGFAGGVGAINLLDEGLDLLLLRGGLCRRRSRHLLRSGRWNRQRWRGGLGLRRHRLGGFGRIAARQQEGQWQRQREARGKGQRGRTLQAASKETQTHSRYAGPRQGRNSIR